MENKQQEIIKHVVGNSLSEETLNGMLRLIKGRPVKDSQNNFLSEADARVYAGNICPATLFHWRNKGLKSYKVGGRRLYRKTDLDNYIFSGGIIRQHGKEGK